MNYEYKGTKQGWTAEYGTICTEGGKTIASVNHGLDLQHREEYPHNIALISAAPELLQACIDAMAALENIGVKNSVTYDRMKQAVHKALNIPTP